MGGWKKCGPLPALPLVALMGLMMNACGNAETGMLPPIKTSGSVSHTYRTRQSGDDPREVVNQTGGNLRGSTYIWQPWFVTTEAGVSFVQETSQTGQVEGEDTLVAGDAELGVLPLSRFPTTIAASRVDSRVEGDFGSEFIHDRASVVQRASFENNLRTQTNFSYDIIDQAESGEEEIRGAGFALTKTTDAGLISLDLNHRDSEFIAEVPTEEDRAGDLNAATLSHSYTPSSGFRMQSTLSYIEDSEATETLLEDQQTVQGVTTQQWRSERYPFTVNTAFRASQDDLAVDGGAVEADDTRDRSVSGTVGINYPIRPRLTANFGLNSLYQDIQRFPDGAPITVEPPAERTFETSLLANINYLSLSRPVGTFMWRWNANANAQARYRDQRTGGNDRERVDGSGGGSWGHTATRPIPVPFMGPGQLSATQSAGLALTSDDPEDDVVVPNIAHDVSVTYRSNRQASATFFRVALSDRREFLAADAGESQLLALQINRQSFIDTRRNWTAALTAQASRRKVREEEAEFVTSATGQLAYTDQRLFNVMNLGFSSVLELNAIGLEDVIRDDNDGDNRFVRERRADWTNRIDYRIGRITTSLEGSVFYVGEEIGNSIFFRIRRDFDGVF